MTYCLPLLPADYDESSSFRAQDTNEVPDYAQINGGSSERVVLKIGERILSYVPGSLTSANMAILAVTTSTDQFQRRRRGEPQTNSSVVIRVTFS